MKRLYKIQKKTNFKTYNKSQSPYRTSSRDITHGVKTRSYFKNLINNFALTSQRIPKYHEHVSNNLNGKTFRIKNKIVIIMHCLR